MDQKYKSEEKSGGTCCEQDCCSGLFSIYRSHLAAKAPVSW